MHGASTSADGLVASASGGRRPVLTYDDHPLIRKLYSDQTISDLSVSYSLQNKRKEREVLINVQAACAYA